MVIDLRHWEDGVPSAEMGKIACATGLVGEKWNSTVGMLCVRCPVDGGC